MAYMDSVRGAQFGELIGRIQQHHPEDVRPFNERISLVSDSNSVTAYHHGAQRRVAKLNWFPGKPDRDDEGNVKDNGNIGGGIISGIVVNKPYRRKGLATSMLEFARDRHPDQEIRHSNALSPDGAAWAERTP